MNIVFGSAFRNSRNNAYRYMKRIADFQSAVVGVHSVRVIAVEGDSTDRTWDELTVAAIAAGVQVQMIKCDHGGPVFGSTEAPARFAALTQVGNAILDAVDILDDVLVYVESDLMWDTPTILRLLERLDTYDVVAPVIMAGPNFYDVFAYRHMNGDRFSPFEQFPAEPFEVSSVGSCLAMKSETAMTVAMPPSGVLVGWCHEARAVGFTIGVDPSCVVNHPC